MATNRRTFLKMMGLPALATALPANIAMALQIPASHRTGTIADVEHIVILMQENRSFDHYFGAMRGVRGFADPHVAKFPSGHPVWYQPTDKGPLLPFRPGQQVGMQFLPDPPHGWNDTHAAWNGGRYDQWVPEKTETTMTYNIRDDIPYHYALADAFTVCDAYHCSLMGPTDPNRYHMWTGWTGNDGNGGGPVLANDEAGYDWSTYPERLERAGISWKIYQDIGEGLTAGGAWGWSDAFPYTGNYGDNSLLYFHQYQNAPANSPLARRARTGTNILTQNQDPTKLVEIFRDDVRHGRLPQVSWIVAPEAYCEHPNWRTNYGAWYISEFLDVLVANPSVWSKTVFLINYDEEGGFFDHRIPPTPPMSDDQGFSTVDTTNEIMSESARFSAGPVGFGIRVPLLVISPWSKGGWVNSQVFDHTSVIRFLEARFAHERRGVIESNITSWRRAVAGDLTSAFDFQKPETWRKVTVPSTDAYQPEDYLRHPDDVPVPPAQQTLPEQERGVRPARALPYTLHVHGAVDPDTSAFLVEFRNVGRATAVLHARSGNSSDTPRSYTVEPHKKVTHGWAIGPHGYSVEVFGPNGFFRAFTGRIGSQAADLNVKAGYDESNSAISLTIRNELSVRAQVAVFDRYGGKRVRLALDPHEAVSRSWLLDRTWGWYDLSLTVEGDESFTRQLAGHIEDGQDSISDPLMGGLV